MLRAMRNAARRDGLMDKVEEYNLMMLDMIAELHMDDDFDVRELLDGNDR